MVGNLVVQEPIYTGFTQHVKGVGPLITATLLYYFGYCEKAKHPSQLWSLAGLTPTSTFKKGEKVKFSPRLRMFCWRIGDCFIKTRGPRYRPVYDDEKARQLKLMAQYKCEACGKTADTHTHVPKSTPKKYACKGKKESFWTFTKKVKTSPPMRLGHCDNRARRKMVKRFLLDYYVMCKHLTGQPASEPWIIEKGGHEHYDDIREWLKKIPFKV